MPTSRQSCSLRPPRPLRFWFMPTQLPCFLDLAFNARGNNNLRRFVRENLWIQDHQGGGGGVLGRRSNRSHHSHAVHSTKPPKVSLRPPRFWFMPTQVTCFLDFTHKIFSTIDLRCFVPESLWIQDHQGGGGISQSFARKDKVVSLRPPRPLRFWLSALTRAANRKWLSANG